MDQWYPCGYRVDSLVWLVWGRGGHFCCLTLSKWSSWNLIPWDRKLYLIANREVCWSVCEELVSFTRTNRSSNVLAAATSQRRRNCRLCWENTKISGWKTPNDLRVFSYLLRLTFSNSCLTFTEQNTLIDKKGRPVNSVWGISTSYTCDVPRRIRTSILRLLRVRFGDQIHEYTNDIHPFKPTNGAPWFLAWIRGSIH